MSIIIANIDPTKLSLDGLLVTYNELATALGVPTRNAKFRDKPTGVKAVNGLIVQAKATESVKDEAPTPGLKRLRNAPQAEALRQRVLQDQEDATRLADRGRDRAPPVRETDPVPVSKPTQRASVADTARVTVLATTNPKRGASALRFALYRSGMTVADYVAAVGNRRKALQDISWDVAKGYIRVI